MFSLCVSVIGTTEWFIFSRAYIIRGRCGQFFSWKLMCDDFLIYLTHGAKIIQMTYIPYSAQPPKLQVCLAKRFFISSNSLF